MVRWNAVVIRAQFAAQPCRKRKRCQFRQIWSGRWKETAVLACPLIPGRRGFLFAGL